jgi:hypothetical protein
VGNFGLSRHYIGHRDRVTEMVFMVSAASYFNVVSFHVAAVDIGDIQLLG